MKALPPARALLLTATLAAATHFAVPHAQETTARAPRDVRPTSAQAAIDRGLMLREDVPRARQAMDVAVAEHLAVYDPSTLIVKFRPGVSGSTRRAVLGRVGGELLGTLAYADFDLVALEATDPAAAAALLSKEPDIDYAQPRLQLSPHFTPNDPLYSRQWSFPLLDMERAWDINPAADASVVVAVIDTGIAMTNAVVQFTMPALIVSGRLYPSPGRVSIPFAAAPELAAPGRTVAPYDFVWDDNQPFDFHGHGTHVAGTIAQLTNNGVGVAGMAANVRLMPLKAFAGIWDALLGFRSVGFDDAAARAMRYAADNGAHVINMSGGREGVPSPVLEAAIRYAVSRGVFVVVSAGNDSLTGNNLSRPADLGPSIDGMVTVGAIGRDRVRAYYSTTGAQIELVAPGGDMQRHGLEGGVLQQTLDFDFINTLPPPLGSSPVYAAPRFDAFVYEHFQGTSMAAPHVAGLAALLRHQGITNPAAIEALLKRTATDLGPPGRDDEYGHGLINPRAALRGMGLAK